MADIRTTDDCDQATQSAAKKCLSFGPGDHGWTEMCQLSSGHFIEKGRQCGARILSNSGDIVISVAANTNMKAANVSGVLEGMYF